MIETKFIEDARNYILEKFKDIRFIEQSHQYFLGSEEYTPVSYIIGRWEIPFDDSLRSSEYAEKNNLKQEDVLDQWKYTNLRATITGSLVHEFAESYGWLKAGFPSKIAPSCQPKFYKDKGWLIPTRPKEVAVKNFLDNILDKGNIYLVGAEFMMHSGYMGVSTKMAGTFDLLVYYDNPSGNSGFILCDYKTNKELTKEYSRNNGKMMKSPFSDLYEEPLGHYTLQFSAYQGMLESIGIPILGRVLIWLKDDETYETIKIENKSELLRQQL
jgi:hypothetical protein